jgi:hypothetical protein
MIPDRRVLIDPPDRIDAFLESVADLLPDVLVKVDDVDVMEISSGTPPSRSTESSPGTRGYSPVGVIDLISM